MEENEKKRADVIYMRVAWNLESIDRQVVAKLKFS